MKPVCEQLAMSTQHYYKEKKKRRAEEVFEEAIVQWVREERQLQPRLGAQKLLVRWQEQAGYKLMGRDRFYNLLRSNGLLLTQKRRKPRTTQSNHGLPVFPNKVGSTHAQRPNEVWVSDFTYLRTAYGFAYLFLITDQCSRKIVGHHLSTTMFGEDAVQALERAIASLPPETELIHHSDRGSQYCSKIHLQLLHEHRITPSMTEKDHCAENAMAERVNGILKSEYALGDCFPDLRSLRKATLQAIHLYNHERPHRALQMDYPARFHDRWVPASA